MPPKFLNHERLDAGLLAIASLTLYLWRLGQVPLRDWDEGTIAMVAREMLRSGEWLHPTLYGGPYLNKPPLVEWL
ncbi:MAG: phospholipid carrier-dependent glycosyltransferase, partial [Cyanobacteria bacterium P01_G01_bin.38]